MAVRVNAGETRQTSSRLMCIDPIPGLSRAHDLPFSSLALFGLPLAHHLPHHYPSTRLLPALSYLQQPVALLPLALGRLTFNKRALVLLGCAVFGKKTLKMLLASFLSCSCSCCIHPRLLATSASSSSSSAEGFQVALVTCLSSVCDVT